MADNSSILRVGTAKAKAFIAADLTGRLGNLTHDMVNDMKSRMDAELPGMTGNVRTSPAGATYANGALHDIVLVGGTDSTRKPLQPKLTKGAKFAAGRQRYDGDTQEYTFTASLSSSGNFQQSENYDFLESQQSGSNEFKATIVGATEYLGDVQVADNFAKCQMEIDKYFK